MNKNFDELKEKIKKVWKDNKFDPNGSYIGTSELNEEPVQDQDDL